MMYSVDTLNNILQLIQHSWEKLYIHKLWFSRQYNVFDISDVCPFRKERFCDAYFCPGGQISPGLEVLAL